LSSIVMFMVAATILRTLWVVFALALGRDDDSTTIPNQSSSFAASDDHQHHQIRPLRMTTEAAATRADDAATTPNHKLSVIVIGAGPAGLVTALGLASVEGVHQVHVLERHESFQGAPRGGTIGIALNGRKAVQEVHPELWRDLERVGMHLPPELGGGLLMPWFDMRMAMVRIAEKQHPRIVMHMGESFATIIVDDIGGDRGVVSVTCESGTELHGDFVVGADGVHSKVRSWLGLPPGIESENVVYRGCATVDETSSSPELRSLLEEGGPVPLGQRQLKGAYFLAFNFHALHPGKIVWVVSTTLDLNEEEQQEVATPLSVLVQAGLGDDEVPLFRELFAKSPPDSLLPTPRARIMQFDDGALARCPEGGWGGRGRVTLVGDAAHGMRPTDGQGGNQAFEDAVVLTRTIRAAALAAARRSDGTTPSIPETLRRFESARLPRVKRIYESQQDRYERRMRGEPVGPLPPEFRDWLHSGV
jgi:2-polyprenyl-6-methoxyphenol hydroxylase-like FAD-dependent oxidoreductase